MFDSIVMVFQACVILYLILRDIRPAEKPAIELELDEDWCERVDNRLSELSRDQSMNICREIEQVLDFQALEKRVEKLEGREISVYRMPSCF